MDNTGDVLAENVSAYTLTATLTDKWTKDPKRPKLQKNLLVF